MNAVVIDTSAIIEIAIPEKRGADCLACLEKADEIFISAGTLVETLIVGRRRGLGPRIENLLRGWAATEVVVTPGMARLVADVYDRWGKGVDPACLNMGNCYAYALAKEMNLPLLFVGDDFSKTDVIPAL
ncbi:type II toxin-antitoxin system VapC family toxin [Azospirillum sp. B4]|uniref:type II toxin-antitoxin system VapC family toxin n=1 Tax=Azospirillum sp. B4 TaxID=95605 RepID=UPI0005C889A3|nr:type II toxin-antitoxin system VapC family toxin [Azospirillum sp. B4]